MSQEGSEFRGKGFAYASLEAVKQSGTPEASAAGDALDIAILFKVRFSYIVAERETTVEAEGEPVSEHALPERAGVRAIPNSKDVLVAQATEDPRLDPFLDATDIASVAVPEEVAGMDVSIPRDE
jgi:hypothetical protein